MIWKMLGRAGMAVCILCIVVSALLWLAGGIVVDTVVIAIAAFGLIGSMAAVLAAEREARNMTLEQTAKSMQDHLGFRIEPTMFDPQGYKVVFVDANGEERATQPAQEWAFKLWEFARNQVLIVDQLRTKGSASGRKKVERDADGDLVIQEKEAETVELQGLGTQDVHDPKGRV